MLADMLRYVLDHPLIGKAMRIRKGFISICPVLVRGTRPAGLLQRTLISLPHTLVDDKPPVPVLITRHFLFEEDCHCFVAVVVTSMDDSKGMRASIYFGI